ncbi:MAG: hypothetical protein CMJ64_26865, partial [Planctomycetaceae bacterium]|nr:hypothetical protein [Planctomycetaceae bacterium]
KMEKNLGGGRDVKMARDLGLERFHAQPKWEIPDKRAGSHSIAITYDAHTFARMSIVRAKSYLFSNICTA